MLEGEAAACRGQEGDRQNLSAKHGPQLLTFMKRLRVVAGAVGVAHATAVTEYAVLPILGKRHSCNHHCDERKDAPLCHAMQHQSS